MYFKAMQKIVEAFADIVSRLSHIFITFAFCQGVLYPRSHRYLYNLGISRLILVTLVNYIFIVTFG